MSRRSTLLVALAVALLGLAVGVGVDLLDDGEDIASGPACVVALTLPDPAVEGGGTYYVATVGADGVVRRITGPDVAHDPALSPDGTRIAYIRAVGDYESAGPEATELWTMGVDGSAPARVATPGRFHETPAWSPDGRSIAFVRREVDQPDELVTVAATGGEATVVARADDPRLTRLGAVDWSADGRRLVHLVIRLDPRGDLLPTQVRSVAAGGGPSEVVADGARWLAVDESPDGTSILVSAVVEPGPAMTVLDAATGAVRDEVAGVEQARWAADGAHAYVTRRAGDRSEVAVVPTAGDGEERVLATVDHPAGGGMSVGPGC